jgi:hypothetical protein
MNRLHRILAQLNGESSVPSESRLETTAASTSGSTAIRLSSATGAAAGGYVNPVKAKLKRGEIVIGIFTSTTLYQTTSPCLLSNGCYMYV